MTEVNAPTGRAGGVYVPPFKLARMQGEVTDKSSKEFQKLAWEALRKSLNGLINKINTTNIQHILPELFHENLVRGRGLFVRAIMKAQLSSPGFTQVRTTGDTQRRHTGDAGEGEGERERGRERGGEERKDTVCKLPYM